VRVKGAIRLVVERGVKRREEKERREREKRERNYSREK